MKRILKAALFSFLTIACLTVNSQNIHFSFTDGSNSVFGLNNVKNITFSSNHLNLNLFDGTTYSWNINVISNYRYSEIVGLKDNAFVVPAVNILTYPNPTAGMITISYDVLIPDLIIAEVFDITGKIVKQILPPSHQVGKQTIVWDGKHSNGTAPPNGTYFVRISSGKYSVSKSFVLTK